MSDTIKLSPEVIALLAEVGISREQLGVLATKSTPRNKKRNLIKPATEYILDSVRSCDLCHTIHTIRLYMKQVPEDPSILKGVHVDENTPENIITSTRYTSWATCGHCREYLRGLDKNDLIDMVMSGKNHAS